jgi:SAM-dependent methyltransferase
MLRKIAVAYTKRWGSPAAKRRVWDAEYQAGRWTYDKSGQHNEAGEPLYRILEDFSAQGSVLDLGCGSGMTALEMTDNFKAYVGVDISEVAVAKARSILAEEPGKADKVRFFASDITLFSPDLVFDVILFRESLYYIPAHAIRSTLVSYTSYLSPRGVFIVRLCDRNKYRSIVATLESLFRVKEAPAERGSAMSVYVCSPATPRKLT